MRYDNTERLGVIETDRIITKEFGWIFREQPIVDVGLDAFIEQSEEGNPNGKFVAVQIKTGKGNFNISEKKITYYVSNIHYNYWLNLEIPIILVAHFPASMETYWQVVNEHTLKKTKKRWRIEIPKNQKLTIKAKNKISQILCNKSCKSSEFELYKGKIEPDTIFDLAEDINCITESITYVNNLIKSLEELKEKTDTFNIEIKNFSKKGLSQEDYEVKASIKGFARQINIVSRNIEKDLEIFSQLYSVGINAYEQVIILFFIFTKNKRELEESTKSMMLVPPSINRALEGINIMKKGVCKLPGKFAVLKESKNYFLEVIEMIIDEYTEAKTIAEHIIDNLNTKNNETLT